MSRLIEFALFWLAWMLLVGVPIIIAVLLLVFQRQKRRIGTVCCKRCNHVGPVGCRFVPYEDLRPVCRICGSDDWTVQSDITTATRVPDDHPPK